MNFTKKKFGIGTRKFYAALLVYEGKIEKDDGYGKRLVS
jgi:hypothetical protein